MIYRLGYNKDVNLVVKKVTPHYSRVLNVSYFVIHTTEGLNVEATEIFCCDGEWVATCPENF